VVTFVDFLSDAAGEAAGSGAFLQEAKDPVSAIKRMMGSFFMIRKD
jgi:hypothetical protein